MATAARRALLLLFWLLLPLLSLRPSPRLMLIPTFSMVDMVGMDLDTLDILATMDWGTTIMESERLKRSPTCMVDTMDMVLDMGDILGTMAYDIATMESVKLSPRLMLMLICTEDTMDMVLDMDTLVLDTMVLDTEFTESALLMLSQKLTPTFCMEDMLDTMDMPDTM